MTTTCFGLREDGLKRKLETCSHYLLNIVYIYIYKRYLIYVRLPNYILTYSMGQSP